MRWRDLRRCGCDPGRFCFLAALIVAGSAAASAQELVELPPPAPWGVGVVRAADLRVLPTKVKHAPIQFPVEALQAGTRATVVVETRIEAVGRIVNARVIRSSPLFDQSVLDAVLQWEYTPTVIDGVAIPVLLTVTVRFTGS